MKKEVLHSAIGLLSRREHSTKELMQKLSIRDFATDDIVPVIDYLLENDYLSHERFADCMFRSRVGKGYGWRYIENELSQKGVERSIIETLNENHQIDWYLQAELAYNKRYFANTNLDQKDKAKRVRFLQYRGFTTDQIMSAINID